MTSIVYQLKQIAEKTIPRKYLRVAGMYVSRATALPLTVSQNAQNAITCPCCNHHFRRFFSYGLNRRPNALCPWCLSLERHRALFLYLKQKTDIFSQPLSILHFAPEHQIQNLLKQAPNISYISADLDMPTAMLKMDITNISFKDNTFDVIICNHVLEHVPNDQKAMQELYRVLKPNGWAILQTPMNDFSNTTFEDLTVTDPKQRELLFGQNDHVRIYGKDKKQRLENAGFEVVLDKFLYELPQETIQKYALLPEDIWVCKKNKITE